MPASGQSQTPAISTFQMDDGGVGNLENSVNRFRGDVSFNQQLLSLPGRPGKKQLDVALTILCQSNVDEQAKRWNLDSPTSILGLGWSLPTERIVMEDNGSPSPVTRVYSYEQNGARNQLVRETGTPRLFSFPFTTLTAGQPIGSTIQQQFTDRGLLIDANALAESIPGTENWTLVDTSHQQLFTLVKDGDQFIAHDGGESYQLQSYQFWKILYYPRFERWLIVKQSGVMSSYGGLGPTNGGEKTSQSNSIEWGVRWGYDANGTEVGVWKGSSALAANSGQAVQQQYATAWRLESISDRWGDRVGYAYNETTVGSTSTGLDAAALVQKVGDANGLSYTKACYLTSITDVFGRQVILRYVDKLYDTTSAEAPREYLDPHKDVPSNDPNAYQDQYETVFLDQIEVRDASGELLLGFDFEYEPRPGQGEASQVANVSGTTGALYGATFKRFLTGITERNAAGESLPGMQFDYYLDPSDANAGALKSITYPQGSTATYTYASSDAATQLDICQRRIEIDPPEAVVPSQEPVPYLWFGPDYAVSAWLNTVQGIVTLRVYTWIGRWAGWQYTEDAVLYSDATAGVSDVEVIAGSGFFGLYLRSGSQGKLFVFQKDAARPGLWLPMMLDGEPSLPLTYDLSQSDLSLEGGNEFLAVLLKNTVDESHTLTSYVYGWPTRSWTSHSWSTDGWIPSAQCGSNCVIENANVYLAASSEFLATLLIEDSGETGQLNLSYLDQIGAWNDAGEVTIDDMQVPKTDQYEPVAITAGASMVAISVMFVPNEQNMDTDLYLVQWDETYTFLPTVHQSFEDYVPSGASLPSVVPQIFDNSLVGCAGHLLRYNGQLDGSKTPQWLVNDNLYQNLDPANGSVQHYAYGGAYGLQGVYQGIETPVANCLFYDPDSDVTSWDRSPMALPVDDPNSDVLRQSANWPSAGGVDFFTLGTRIYPRYGSGGSDFWTTDWQSTVNPPASVGSNLGSESVVDQAPGFISFLEQQDDGSYTDAQAFLLENGQVSRQQTLSGEKYFTASETSGTDTLEVGAGPAGPSSLVTYPSSAKTFEKASKIFLYRWAGNALAGPIVHYPVELLTIDDGFGQAVETCYTFDVDTATCDPSGTVVQYRTSTSYRGCSDPADSQNGSTVCDYINGYENATDLATYPADPDSPRWSMLTGVQRSKAQYRNDQVEVARNETEWTVYTEINGDPSTPDLQNLFGGFVSRAAEIKTQDGVSTRIDISYLPGGLSAPFSGLPVEVTSSVIDISGQTQTFTEALTYGYEVTEQDYDCGEVFRALNQLSQRLATTSWTSTEAGTPVVASAKASTVKPWSTTLDGITIELPATDSSFAFPGGSFSVFPFASWIPGDDPSGWQLTSRVLQRSAKGLATESINAGGSVSSTLFSDDEGFVVGQFTNASLSHREAAYLGFESYESTTGWTLSGGATEIETDAHAGTASLELPSGGSLSTSLTPGRPQTYLLSFFYKTSSGFSDNDSGWTVTVTDNGQAQGTPVTVPFDDTGGTWREKSVGLPISSGTNLGLELTASHSGSGSVLLDDIRVTPLVCQFSANAYDLATRLPTAQIDLGASTQRTARDTFLRDAVLTSTGTGGGDQITSIHASFLSRQGNAGNIFQASSPNAEIQVTPAEGGTLETFRDGDAWQNRWQPSPAADWSVHEGELQHTTNADGTLTRQLDLAHPSRGWALYFELISSSTLTGTCGIEFGTYTLQWNADTSVWQFLDGGNPVMTPLASPPTVAQTWLLVQGEGTLAFFADGQLIFSRSQAPSTAPTLTFSSGANVLSLRNLSTAAAPRLSLTYLDATGRAFQNQQLTGTDALVDQTIYDSVGQAVAQTKGAPANYGQGGNSALLLYRDTFVDVDAFLGVLDGSGVMQGDVADYYSANNPQAPSDDEGYPYTRKRLEASPLARVIEEGQPGQRYAIIDPATTSPESRSTTQYTYAANQPDTLPHGPTLPAAAFRVETKISPTKVESAKLVDALGRTSAQFKTGQGADGISPQSTVLTTFDENGRTSTTQLPNSFTSGPQQDPTNFVTTSLSDPLGQVIRTTGPDTGTVQNMYDSLGQLRFVQMNQTPPTTGGSCQTPAVQAGILYNKYDALGRLIEAGTCDFDWTESNTPTLRAYADDPDWPSATSEPPVNFEIGRATTYDGDGESPGALGQPTLTSTINRRQVAGDPLTITVTDVVVYFPNGQAQTTTTQTDEPSNSTAQTVTYAYNEAGQVVEMTYPSSALDPVTYGYNELSQVVSVGTSNSPDAYATYSYYPDGSVASEDLQAGSLSRIATLEPPGWPATSTLTSSAQPALSGSQSYTYFVDGKIQTYDRQITDGTTSGPFDASYSYDPINRLQTADVASNTNLSSSIPSGGYDDNGNIYTLNRGDQSNNLTMDYSAGLDLIATVDQGEDTNSVCWDADGRMTSVPQLGANGTTNQLSYDASLGMTSNVQVQSNGASKDVTLVYGQKNQRTLKRIDDGTRVSSRLYVRGPDGEVLSECMDDGTTTSYIQGPNGLLAFQSNDGTLYYPFADHNGSFYAVANSAGQLAATYDYTAFGVVQAAGPSPDILRYLYTGQEFDSETGLYNYNARLYDPWLARFCAADPQHQFASPYVYVDNNPISFTDPSGEFSWDAFAAGLISGAEIVAGVAIIALTDGAGSMVGAALIGAGVSGVVSSIENRDQTGKDFWSSWGKSEVIGAAGGLITGGIGAASASLSSKLALSGGKLLLAQVATGIAAGAASSVGTQAMSIGLSQLGWGEQQSWSNLYSWSSIAGDLFSVGLGAVGGAASWGLRQKFPKAKVWAADDEQPRLPQIMDADEQGNAKYLGASHTDADPNGWTTEPQKRAAFNTDYSKALRDQQQFERNMAKPKISRFLFTKGPGQIYISGAGVSGRIPLLAGPTAFNSKKLFSLAYKEFSS